MYMVLRRKTLIRTAGIVCLAIVVVVVGYCLIYPGLSDAAVESSTGGNSGYIRWVDFNVTYEAMDYALKLDVESHGSEQHLNWIELLAYIAAKNGNNFKNFKTKHIDSVADQLRSGKTMAELTENMKYYSYYKECFETILSGFAGEYEIEVPDTTTETGKRWERRYGLMAFSPIAKAYPYYDYDDFGASRSYGFDRRHLGHDMMGSTGTPIIAIEGGVIEAMGWNQYGGWRIGIRSFDGKRYYYYAHLRKDFPYHKSLKEGSVVMPGDVIGYLGRTGYSRKENANNIRQSHLHVGMQLIFDESQKEGNNEIWIDIYPITQLLYRNRVEVVKDSETKDYSRKYQIRGVSETMGDAGNALYP